MDKNKILSFWKKNLFITSTQVQNNLEEVGVSLTESTVKSRFYESKYTVYDKVQNNGNTEEQEGQIRLYQ